MRNGLAATILGLILLSPRGLAGQENAAQRHQRLIEAMKKVAAEISARSLADVGSLEEWKERRPAHRRRLLYMLGLDPLPERTPLKAEVTGKLDRAAYRIERLVFQSLPGLYVTGNFYLPREAAGRLPTVLYVCGHSPHPKGAKHAYQDRGTWFAERGYACLVLDTLEFGEVAGPHHGIHDLNLWNWLSLGYTPSGVEVWNAIRAIDYLETRAEVDARRIGMTGISGGGAVTWFTAAVEDRVAAAAPVCATYTIGSQAAHWVAAGQCDCIYVHNTYLEDFPVVAALIAPRPLLLCSGQKDGDFPPDGYREVYRRAKRIYDLHAGGDSDRIKEVDDNVGHSDTPLFRKEARQWMNRWLRKDETPLAVEPLPGPPRESADDLACLASLPEDAVNYRIHDTFVAAAKSGNWTTPEGWNARRKVLIDELRDKVFRGLPKEKVPFETKVGRDTGGWAARYAEFKEVVFESEPGVPIRAKLLKSRKSPKEAPVLVYAKRAGDSIHPMDIDDLLPLLGRYTVLVLTPRLTEHPVTAREYADIERTASWIGRTVASMQVWDILRGVEWLFSEEKLTPTSVSVHGRGEMGILAVYAGLFDERIGQVILKDPPSSHRQGPALLNVLRVTDIPEASSAFAPRKLVFLGAVPGGFETTRTVYGLLGKGENLTSAASLPEALEAWKY